MTDEKQPPREAVAAATVVQRQDAGAAVEAVAQRLGVAFDGFAVANALGRHPFEAGSGGRMPPVQRALAALGLEPRWGELLPRHARAVWMASTPWRQHAAAVVAVLGRRGLRHDVVVCRGGNVTRHRLFASQLERALGIGRGGTIGAVTAAPAQPLGAMHAPTGKLEPWQRFARLLRIERDDIGVTAVYGLGIGVLSLVLPIAAQALVTTVTFGTVLQPLVVLTVLFALGASAAGVLRLMQAWVVEVIQQRIFARAMSDVARRLASMPYSVLDKVHVPDLINRFFEVPTIQKSVAALLVEGVGLLLQTVLGLALLGFYHPLLLAFSATLVLLLSVVVFGFGRGAVASALDESKAKYRAVGWLENLARVPLAFKSAQGRQLALSRADQAIRHYLDARRRHFAKLLLQTGGGVALAVIGSTALLGLGGLLVLRNQLTLGQLVAAELVMAMLSAAFVKLGKQLEATYDLVQAATKLGLLVDLPAERGGGEPARRGTGPIAVRATDLSFSYGTTSVLRRCSLAVAAGQRIALLGEGGAGKSTLVDLLATLRTPTGGNVEIDGCDVRLVDLAELRQFVTLVRGADFIQASILENLRLLRQDAELHEVEHAVECVGLGDIVRRLDQGLGTQLQPGGAPLSSTQLQRLALARALLAQPRLLLLDGALDQLGVDGPSKAAILECVLGKDAPWTAIVVSRDSDVLARCTHTTKLVDGMLEESR